MKKESRKDYLLKLWKIRQEAEGYDVSRVTTLEEAEHFFDKKFGNKKVTEGATTTIEAPKSYKELQVIGKELGLKTTGVKKEDLIAAIKEAEEAKRIADEEAKKLEEEKQSLLNELKEKQELTEENLLMSNDELKALLEEIKASEAEGLDGTVEDIEIPVIPVVTEEVVQAVAGAIVEEATETNKTVEEVVTDIVNEGEEAKEVTEPSVEGEEDGNITNNITDSSN